MSLFDPQPGMRLRIGASTYEFLSQLLLPGDPMGVSMVEGQEGFIYALRDLERGHLWALKVLKPAYRSEHTALVTDKLAQFWETTGFYLSHRVCITRPVYDQLITAFPALEYALLMPWLSWKTWTGLLRSPEASLGYTRDHALALALSTAHVLWELEQRGCAHTDIAGGNVMYAPDFQKIEVLDLEGIYIPGLPPPKYISYGSPGYQQRKLGKQGQYSAFGDRFAGAILLTEMLTWWHPLVREQVPENAISLFLPEELQIQGGPRWKIARDVLWSLNPPLLNLFDQVWASSQLKHCPDFKTWLSYLSASESRARSQPSSLPLHSDQAPT